MTVILGVLCRDGTVVGSDGASSQSTSKGLITYERAKQKIWILPSGVFGATSGNAALGQRVKVGVNRFFRDTETEFSDPYELGDSLRMRVRQELEQIEMKPSNTDSSMVAFQLEKKNFLLTLKGEQLTPRMVEDDLFYQAIGGGANLAQPFFEFLRETFWINENLPSVGEARIGVEWTLQHTVSTSSRGVSFPLNVVSRTGSDLPCKLRNEEIEEPLETIKRMQKKLREYMLATQSESSEPIEKTLAF